MKIKHAALIIVLFVALRWAVGGFDFSYFINAGTTSCDSTVTDIIVQKGYNFDGLFFYRYSLNPFNTDNPYQGIRVGEPVYRHQRILYPVFTWLASFGGYKPIVPFVLVFINIIAFILLLFGVKKLLEQRNIQQQYLWIALLIPGIWMGLARDLTEPLEFCFFIYLLVSFHAKNKTAFLLLATCMIFSRETSAIVLMVFCFLQAWQYLKKEQSLRETFLWMISAAIPVICFVLFRLWLHQQYPDLDPRAVTFSAVPYKGLYDGTILYINEIHDNGTHGLMKALFALISLLILIVVFYKAIILINFKQEFHFETYWFAGIIVTWILLSMVFTERIWLTDWGFMRAMNIPFFAALFICASKQRLSNRWLKYLSVFILLLLVRMIVKV